MAACSKAEGLDAGTETASNLHQKLYCHRLGTDQAEDVLCYEAPDEPKWMFGAEVTDDGKVSTETEAGRLHSVSFGPDWVSSARQPSGFDFGRGRQGFGCVGDSRIEKRPVESQQKGRL